MSAFEQPAQPSGMAPDTMPRALVCALVAEDLYFRVPGVDARIMQGALSAAAAADPDVGVRLTGWADRLVDESMKELVRNRKSPSASAPEVLQPQGEIL